MSSDGLLRLIRRRVAEAGFDLVDLTIGGNDSRPVLRVKADLPDSEPGHGITVDQCAALSRMLEKALEAEHAVGERYVLEVSSPGLERPVRWPEHWRRFVGRQVRVKSSRLGGRKTASIVEVPDDEHVVLQADDQEPVTMALDDISQATLVVDWQKIGKP